MLQAFKSLSNASPSTTPFLIAIRLIACHIPLGSPFLYSNSKRIRQTL